MYTDYGTRSIRTQYWENRNGTLIEKNRDIVDRLMRSDNDFSAYGRSKLAASVIGCQPQKVANWMRRYMPEFYASECFTRKEKDRQ